MFTVVTPPPEQWDAFVSQHPYGHIYECSTWGELDHWANGWDIDRVALTQNGQIVAGAQLLFYHLPAPIGAVAYLRKGPLVSASEQWLPLWDAIDQCVRQHHAVFLRWRTEHYHGNQEIDFAQLGFQAQIQEPSQTILLDIGMDDETILMRMKRRTRYNIRQSQKNSLRYYEGSRADVGLFAALMQAHGKRKHFYVQGTSYFEHLYDLLIPKNGVLIFAEDEGAPVAAAMIFASGCNACYGVGGSTGEKSRLNAGYGVQWKGIQWAKARGCQHYDLSGITHEDTNEVEERLKTEAVSAVGGYFFKRGWGGELGRSSGTWDRIYNQPVYWIYQKAIQWRKNLRQRRILDDWRLSTPG